MKVARVGIMTGGGDCPGLNAVIQAFTTTAILKYGIEVVGIKHGYRGLFIGEDEFIDLDIDMVSGIMGRGGTILYSSNKDNLFDYSYEKDGKVLLHRDASDIGIRNLKKACIDALVVIGGDGTLTSGRDFSRKGVKVIGVPKTIDNDLASTDTTFGFDTAVSVVTDAIDRLSTTAQSHERVMIVEVMGRYAGFIALNSGIASGADVILIPEIPYSIDKITCAIKSRYNAKRYGIVVVAEGAKSIRGDVVIHRVISDSPDPIRLGGVGGKIADDLEKLLGTETRAVTLGHVQRGGTPTSYDRILSVRYGVKAADILMEGKFGHMVTFDGRNMSCESLENVIGANKAVEIDGDMVKTARSMNICFGD